MQSQVEQVKAFLVDNLDAIAKGLDIIREKSAGEEQEEDMFADAIQGSKKDVETVPLSYLRRERGLSQAELAETLGIPASELSRIETGVVIPNFKQKQAIEDWAQCRLETLFVPYFRRGKESR
jgi:ribosome-binding protein aMBF1 (putative translation factor)